MALTILEGSTFCICDERGDIYEQTGGFFARDTRFLSCFRLTVNGRPPLLLSSGKVEYFSAAFYLRNAPVDGLAQDSVAIVRERFVSDAMQERIVVENVTPEPVSFELAIQIASDFADIFAVKEHDFALGDPVRAKPFPEPATPVFDPEHAQFVIDDPEENARTQVAFSKPGEVDGDTMRYRVELAPRACWEVTTDVVPYPQERRKVARPVSPGRFGQELARVHDSLTAWQLHVPRLEASWDALEHAFARSVSDLASLRMRGGNHGITRLPAAGMPWFMTVFGRDTLITSYQTLLFGPELARGALEVLADLQAVDDDPSIDAEPGKIVHEVRHGKAAKVWFPRYYGTVDATPLYPRAALGGVAVDAGLGPPDEAARAGAPGARVDRRARRPRRRRLRRVPAPDGARAREPVVEGLRRLAALRGRTACGCADRTLRGAGVRLRREAAGGGARPRGLERSGARRAARGARPSSYSSASTRRSGSTSAAGTTRSRSTPRRSASTRCAPTSGTCSGAGSSRRSGPSRWSRR